MIADGTKKRVDESSPNGAINYELELAAAAISRGDLNEGRTVLKRVLNRAPNNAAAWYWMGYCEENNQAKQECYERVKERAERPSLPYR